MADDPPRKARRFGHAESAMLSLPKNLRTWLLRGVIGLLGLTLVLLVAAALWGLLRLLGDATGAVVARGVVAVGIGWLAVLAALVVLLAWERLAERVGDQQLLRSREGEAPAEPDGNESHPFEAAPRDRRPPTTPTQSC
jgi:hypothetical protein